MAGVPVQRSARCRAFMAGTFGFIGVARAAGAVAKVLFGAFLVVALVLFVRGATAV